MLGSRIRRTQAEGPAPIPLVSAEEMRAGGYADIPEVLAALEYYYVGWKDSDGSGARNHAARGAELSVPLLRTEADCRIGSTSGGSPVDGGSPTCLDAIARVHRYASGPSAGEIESVDLNPVNVAHEATTGIDVSTHLRLPVVIGKPTLGLDYTHVIDHDYQRCTATTSAACRTTTRMPGSVRTRRGTVRCKTTSTNASRSRSQSTTSSTAGP